MRWLLVTGKSQCQSVKNKTSKRCYNACLQSYVRGTIDAVDVRRLEFYSKLSALKQKNIVPLTPHSSGVRTHF